MLFRSPPKPVPVIDTAIGSIDTLAWGDGADLLLILHASCTGPRAYTGLADRLSAPDRRIIAPALAGYGATRFNETAPDDHTARNCAAAQALLDTDRFARRTVFGHSMGGVAALQAALDCARAGQPADALILYEPILHGFLDRTIPEEADAFAWDRGVIVPALADIRAGRPEDGVRRFVEAWNDTAWDDLPDRVRQQLVANADTLAAESASLPGHKLGPDDVRDFRTPTLVLCGDRSPAFTRLAAANLARAIPGADAVTLEGAGHMAPLDAPERISAAIESFLTEQHSA